MLRLNHFLYVIEVVKMGSINKAAEQLYVSQPHLSTSLKELEALLQVKLFKRSQKGVQLTEEGEQFLEYALQIKELIEKAQQISGERSDDRAMRIAGFHSYALLDLFYAFKQQMDEQHKTVTYLEVPNQQVTDVLLREEADLGILYLDSIGYEHYLQYFNMNQLHFEPFYREKPYAIVSRLHPLYALDSISMEMLADSTLLLETYKLDDKKFDNPLKTSFKEVKVESMAFNNSRSLMYYLTKSNHHFSLGQLKLNRTNPFVQSGELKYVYIEDCPFELITGCLIKAECPQGEVEKQFIEAVKQLT